MSILPIHLNFLQLFQVIFQLFTLLLFGSFNTLLLVRSNIIIETTLSHTFVVQLVVPKIHLIDLRSREIRKVHLRTMLMLWRVQSFAFSSLKIGVFS